jgi:predicted DNA-binding transcriptional regulator YafY
LGKRSGTETIVAIVRAFLDHQTWSQAALAQRIKISSPAVRRRLEELVRNGFPIEREEDHPHVWWSVPKGWLPGAIAFEQEDASLLLDVLVRAPRSDARTRLLERLLRVSPRKGGTRLTRVVLSPSSSQTDDTFIPLLERLASEKITLCMKYYSASRGALEERRVSVQRILPGPPARFVGHCHRSKALKWFRVDNILSAHADPASEYAERMDEELVRFVARSVDGYGGVADTECSFFVREPESRWVIRNLLPPMVAEQTGEGVRVHLRTGGILRVARFVVGLGDAARCETPDLGALVRGLAEGALANALRARPTQAQPERVSSRA